MKECGTGDGTHVTGQENTRSKARANEADAGQVWGECKLLGRMSRDVKVKTKTNTKTQTVHCNPVREFNIFRVKHKSWVRVTV